MLTHLKIFLLLVELHPLLAFLFGDANDGDLSPRNPYWIFGEVHNVTCTLYRKDINASQLYLEVGDKRVPSNLTSVASASELIAEIPISKEFFKAGYNTIVCLYNEDIINTISSEVEYAVVHNVTDFECIMIDYNKELRCSWNLGEYYKPQNIEVNFSVSANGFGWVSCNSFITKDRQSCSFNSSSGISMNPLTYYFRLNITNKMRGKTVLFNYTVRNIDSIVKPAKAENFEVFNVTSRTAHFSWGMLAGKSVVSMLIFKTKWSTTTMNITSRNGLGSLKIKDLKPYSNYSVSLQLRLQNGLHLSDIANVAFTTNIDVPDVGPMLHPASFHMDSTHCKENSGRRNVTLYWKPIPEEMTNGKIVNYTVVYNPETQPNNQGFSVVNGSMQSSALNLYCNQRYNVKVKGYTLKGVSNYSDEIIVPKVTDVTPLEDIVVQVPSDESSVDISWEGDDPYAEHIIFWCPSNTANIACVSSVQNSNIIKQGKNQVIIDSSNVSGDISGQRFGVAKQKQLYFSGITWEACRYKKDLAPSVPQKVTVDSKIPNKMLRIRWASPKCDRQSGYVAKYRIKWCEQDGGTYINCNDQVFAVPEVPLYEISSLDVDKTYGIQLQALSPRDIQSDYTEVVTGKPTTNELSEIAWIGIVVGVVIASTLVIIGICCILRCVRNSWKKMTKPYTIEVPTIGKPILERNNSNMSTKERNYESGSLPYTSDLLENGNLTIYDNATKESNPFLLPLKIHCGMDRQESNDSGRDSMNSPTSPVSILPPIDEDKKEINGDTSSPPGYSKASLAFNATLLDPVDITICRVSRVEAVGASHNDLEMKVFSQHSDPDTVVNKTSNFESVEVENETPNQNQSMVTNENIGITDEESLKINIENKGSCHEEVTMPVNSIVGEDSVSSDNLFGSGVSNQSNNSESCSSEKEMISQKIMDYRKNIYLPHNSQDIHGTQSERNVWNLTPEGDSVEKTDKPIQITPLRMINGYTTLLDLTNGQIRTGEQSSPQITTMDLNNRPSQIPMNMYNPRMISNGYLPNC